MSDLKYRIHCIKCGSEIRTVRPSSDRVYLLCSCGFDVTLIFDDTMPKTRNLVTIEISKQEYADLGWNKSEESEHMEPIFLCPFCGEGSQLIEELKKDGSDTLYCKKCTRTYFLDFI